ncbi:alpha-catulin isoform X1 [Episyrphus balteatus]|uniref:alpha-catulin isoform X1 n=1 Tax=Episyrphus balteatus TaxID=286459 RepID=UPI002484DCEB|nr:alpha-catulin isoform X1 [Episyrphus balteatus]
MSKNLVHQRGDWQSGRCDHTLRVMCRIGQAVSLAVERFATVGESIAENNVEIRMDMHEACHEARSAGATIERLCETAAEDPLKYPLPDDPLGDRSAMIHATRSLLGSVTRVLLLADIVLVKKLLLTKDKVAHSLGRLQSVGNFTEFVTAFSIFGAEMIELAHVTGKRQNDLKEERRRAQMSAARQVLERSTTLLFTSSKTCLRHLECPIAKENRDTVFCHMRSAIDLIHFVVKDSVNECMSIKYSPNRSQARVWESDTNTAHSAIINFVRLLEICRLHHKNKCKTSTGNNAKQLSNQNITHLSGGGQLSNNALLCENMDGNNDYPLDQINSESSIFNSMFRQQLLLALEKVVERTQDFTDSAYTSHENREHILLSCNQCKLELNQCARIAINLEQFPETIHYDLDTSLDNIQVAVNDLSQQLTLTVLDLVTNFTTKIKIIIDIINSFKTIALNQELDRMQEMADRFHDYCDYVLDVCKLLQHVALTETLKIQAKFTEINLRIYSPQVLNAAKILSAYPSCKISLDNLNVFIENWECIANDTIFISRQIIEMCHARTKFTRQDYTSSLPCLDKQGAAVKSLKPVTLDTKEEQKVIDTQDKIPTNEVGTEDDKWNSELEENNDIVKRAKNMSSMAFSMHQFTKGNGNLRTTQDLFTQAEYFAEEANRLYKVVRQFSYQVPAGQNKKELLDHLDKVPTYVQSLQFTVKDHTVGRAATFVKVDHVMRETKNLLNVINKVVTECLECANKYKLDFTGLTSRTGSGAIKDEEGGSGMMMDSKGSTNSTEGSM